MDEQQLQKMMMQLEYGRRQMDQLGKQAQLAESALAEINSTADALDTLRGQKPGTEMMVQVGAGTFIKAELKDAENVLVGIGAEMSVVKKLPDAVVTLQARGKQLAESLAAINKTMGELSLKLAELNSQAQEMAGTTQQS